MDLGGVRLQTEWKYMDSTDVRVLRVSRFATVLPRGTWDGRVGVSGRGVSRLYVVNAHK